MTEDELRKLAFDLLEALEWIEGVYDRGYDLEPNITTRARDLLEGKKCN